MRGIWVMMVLAGCGATPTGDLDPAGDAGPASPADAASAPDAALRPDATPDAGPLRYAACGVVGLGTITHAAPSPDAATIALATAGGELALISAISGEVLWRTAIAGADELIFSADGTKIFVAQSGYLQAFRATDARLLWRNLEGPLRVARLAVSGGEVALGGPPVVVFDIATGDRLRTIEHPVTTPDSRVPGVIAYAPGGGLAAAHGDAVHVIDAQGQATGLVISADFPLGDLVEVSPSVVESMSFSPDGERLLIAVRRAGLTSGGLGYVAARLFRVRDGAVLSEIYATAADVSVALSADGEHVAVRSGGAVDWRSLRDESGAWRAVALTVASVPSDASAVRIDARDRLILLSEARGLRVHVPGAVEPELTVRAPTPDIGPFALSPDGRRLIRSAGGAIEVWALSPAEVPHRLRTLAEDATIAAVSPDGWRIAVARPQGVEVIGVGDGTSSGLIPVTGARTLAFGPASFVVATDSTLGEWSLDGQSIASRPAAAIAEIRATAAGWLTRDPTAVVLWSTDGALTSTMRVPAQLTALGTADVSRDGALLLLTDLTSLRGIEIPSGNPRRLFSTTYSAHNVQYAPDGSAVAIGFNVGLRVHGLRNSAPLEFTELLAEAGPAPRRVSFSGDGRVLAVAGFWGDTRLYCR